MRELGEGTILSTGDGAAGEESDGKKEPTQDCRKRVHDVTEVELGFQSSYQRRTRLASEGAGYGRKSSPRCIGN